MKLNQFFHTKETFTFKSIPKMMDSVWHWVLWKEKLVDFDAVIKIYFAGVIIFKFKSPCRKNEPVNQELF